VSTEAEQYPVLSPDRLMVAASLAVDLDPARRQTIPAQHSAPPDAAAYSPHCGGVLLLPRTATTAAPAPHRARELAGGVQSSSGQPPQETEQHAEVWMRMHTCETDTGDLFPARLIFRPAEPHAITAVFNSDTEDERAWTFARDLLADGRQHSVGLGDVIVWPGTEDIGATADRRVFFRLRCPDGTALLSMTGMDATAFLDSTQPFVPVASVSGQADTLVKWRE
jgi:hypothetical protein